MEARLPTGTDAAALKVTVGHRDVTPAFAVRSVGRYAGRYVGLVDGLADGTNELRVHGPTGRVHG